MNQNRSCFKLLIPHTRHDQSHANMHACAQPSLEHVVAICAEEPQVACETHLSRAVLGSSGTCAAELEGAPVDYVRACRSYARVLNLEYHSACDKAMLRHTPAALCTRRVCLSKHAHSNATPAASHTLYE